MKKEVKNYLLAILGGAFIIGIIILSNNSYNKAVQSCVDGGNNYNYCVEKLS